MIYIKDIASYIPTKVISNRNQSFGGEMIEETFLEKKIGITEHSCMEDGWDTSDMCVKAIESLLEKTGIGKDDIECLCICTQNGDYQLPHTSAIVHHKLMLSSQCAFFDINLGCSGYVYSLGIIKGFMEINDLKKGVLVTCDPYSKIIDTEDKNTSLLFGDAAVATLLDSEGIFSIGKAAFASDTGQYDRLIKQAKEPLYMDGRAIYNFALRQVPKCVQDCLDKNGNMEIDAVLFHQASKYVIEALERKLRGILPDGIRPEWVAENCGNTVSSSIPILLEHEFSDKKHNKILLCGFGVGLSVASITIQREGGD